jgi:hypothetical protein
MTFDCICLKFGAKLIAHPVFATNVANVKILLDIADLLACLSELIEDAILF